ncbi:MAG: flotillin family protein, partial [Hyphomicrobiales bacterium]
MTGTTLISALAIAAIIAVVLFFRFYRKASKEIAFVRTGLGGEKVVMGGGAIVVPVLQEVTEVNLNTLRLGVELANQQAVISKDRMRVDVVAEFYVHVPPTTEAVSTAAATLGSRTLRPESVRDIAEGKFIDAIRSMAAEMTMEELHEKRKIYAAKIRDSLTEDLSRNGLALESVSVTALDQTSMEHFNPSNAFDAEGLTRLTETIEQRKKKRNDIEQDTQIQIRNKNLETEKLNLSLEREEQFARLEQELDIEGRKAEQTAEIARQRAVQALAADEADIEKKKKVEIAKILSDREVDEERLDRERALR